jgi:hypothetical protein
VVLLLRRHDERLAYAIEAIEPLLHERLTIAEIA